MALDRLLINSRQRRADMMDKAFTHVLDRINHRYKDLSLINQLTIAHLDQEINRIFEALTFQLVMEVVDLRKKTYMLSHVGEAQAIAGSLNLLPKFKADQHTLNELAHKPFVKGDMIKMIGLTLNAIRRKIITKIEECLLTEEPVESALYFTFKQFPRKMAPPSKAPLKKVKPREANTKPAFSIEDGDTAIEIRNNQFTPFVWDQSTWNQMLDDYQKDYIKIDRSPASVYSLNDPLTQDPVDVKYEDGIYAWEVEKEVTHDFVSQVRDGQIKAANDQGIDDFIVIAVIDDHTCDSCCGDFGCADFDGMLVSEIIEMTKGEYSTPGYHFSCRCTLAPHAESDKGLDDLSSYGDFVTTKKDFDEWLNQ